MDVLLEFGNSKVKLSSKKILVTDFKDTSPEVEINKRTIRNRPGFVFDNVTDRSKSIRINGYFSVSSAYELEEKKDELNGLFCTR